MNLKELFKPSREKIMLLPLFMILSFFIVLKGPETLIYQGFPLPYLLSGCPGAPPQTSEIRFCYENEFILPFFAIDIFFWYVISCVLVWFLTKSKKVEK